MYKHKINNSGFTLVELAIVLVIVGLLVGGVLQGQELIKQAKINRFIGTINSYKLSFETFRLKYDQLPGVYDRASQTWPNCLNTIHGENLGGGCNGAGGSFYRNNQTNIGGGNEFNFVWRHLSLAGLTKENFNTDSTSYLEYVPAGDLPGIAKFPIELNFSISGDLLNTVFSSVSLHLMPSWLSANVKLESIRAVDTKTDDGRPYTGIMRAMGSCYENADININQYAVDTQSADCLIFMKVM